jgi:type IV pilus assembly protein PilN
MIKINLLAEGKRAVTRKAKGGAAAAALERRDLGSWLLGVGVLLGLLVFAGYWFYLRREIQQKDEEIAVAQREVDELAAIIKEVEDYKAKKAELEHKIGVINQLKANQAGPVKLMDHVSRALPELLWLDSMEVIGTTVRVNGQAFNTNAVANFIENLDKVPEFQEPILLDTAQQGAVYGFAISFGFQLALPPEAAAAPAPDSPAGRARAGGAPPEPLQPVQQRPGAEGI